MGSFCCPLSLAAPSGAALFGDDVARKGVQEQQKRIDGLSARYDELAARFSKLEESVKASTAAATQPVFDLSNQLQVLREDLRSVRGQLEVLSNSIEANAKRQRDMYVDLDTRLRRIRAGSGGARAACCSGNGGAGSAACRRHCSAARYRRWHTSRLPALPRPPRPDLPLPSRRRNNGSMMPRKLTVARATIRRRSRPSRASSRNSRAARSRIGRRTWIGDSYYNLRDFKNAITAQQKLISTYPDSTSIPDGMLNLASSQIELGQTAAARKTMDSLLARYPTSDAAEKAKRRLASLR